MFFILDVYFDNGILMFFGTRKTESTADNINTL